MSFNATVHKCVIVVDKTLGQGHAANAVSIIGVTLRGTVEGLFGPDVQCPDNANAPGIICAPLPVLLSTRLASKGPITTGELTFASWGEHCRDLPVAISAMMTESVPDSDVIFTTAAARTPILARAELPERCPINAIGGQASHEDGGQGCALFMHCNRSVLAVPECVIKAIVKGLLPGEGVDAEICAVCVDDVLAHEAGVTIFKSVGLAEQDLVFSREVARQWVAGFR
ncbi:DUF2000 family protein [Pseudomonas sp. FEN]|uniref:DUF2000 family protein n=1 Tax=Pseudomonas sp. FEN TaxID=2767468 RepID=UPI00174BA65C|nr:DUF2000 family protein [Pseudomonas sp. FEN]CAD5199966.1 hypothetical protein [Pseudomonas sp. FEN]